jgi:multiple sugar transport system permease protein
MSSRYISPPLVQERSGGRGFRLSNAQFGVLLALPALALFATVILYPLLNSMVMGFMEKSLVYPGEAFVGFKNIERFLRRDFVETLQITLIFTLGATIMPFMIGFGVALLLNTPIRGRGLLRGMFLLPWLIPSVIVSFLWMWIFNANYGVLNGALRSAGFISQNINWLGDKHFAMWAVILAKTWNTFPWIAVMILAGLQTIPSELYEAAAIDGANRFQRFWNITVTQLRGVITTVLLLSFIWNFQHFETIYVMTTGGPAGATTTFSVAVYQMAFQEYDLGKAGAIGLVWMALLSVIVLVYLRFSVQEQA